MITVRLVDNTEQIRYQSEADIQDGVAQMAEAYGWAVQREMVIPGWGRLDLVLHENDGDFRHVIEFKRELTKLSMIRKAFQQADGYSRWLRETGRRSASDPVILAAGETDWSIVNDIAYVYRESVRLMDVARVMGMITDPDRTGARLVRARNRLERAAVTYRLSVHALNNLNSKS